MPYSNPYRIFDLDPSEGPLSMDQWRRIQRKVLAEFELGGEVVVEIGGVEMDKSRALDLLDELREERINSYHRRTMAEPGWWAWLEGRGNDPKELPKEIDFEEDGFRQWLGEQLKEPVGKYLRERLREMDYAGAAAVVTRLEWMNGMVRNQALEPALRYIQAREDQVRGWIGELQEMDLGRIELRAAVSPEWVGFLNALPGIYQQNRNRWAILMRDLAFEVVTQRMLRRRLAYDIVAGARRLHTDYGTKAALNSFFDQLQRYKNRWDILGWWNKQTYRFLLLRFFLNFWLLTIVGSTIIFLLYGLGNLFKTFSNIWPDWLPISLVDNPLFQ